MGYFLAVSAFRSDDCELLQQGIVDYSAKHNVVCEARGPEAQDARTDARIYAPERGWIRVLWPAYFNIYDFQLCRTLASQLHLTVSTIHVYDGDFWEHLFLNGDDEIHKFSSSPTYFAETSEEAEQSRARWKGDAHALSSLLGIPMDRISGYLVHLPLEQVHVPAPQPSRRSWLQRLIGREGANVPSPRPAPKAYPDDEFSIEDFWVFTDFWRQLGIAYPEPVDEGVHSVLRFDDINKLPVDADSD